MASAKENLFGDANIYLANVTSETFFEKLCNFIITEKVWSYAFVNHTSQRKKNCSASRAFICILTHFLFRSDNEHNHINLVPALTAITTPVKDVIKELYNLKGHTRKFGI